MGGTRVAPSGGAFRGGSDPAVIRVVLPQQLRILSSISGELSVDLALEPTISCLIDHLEELFPVLKGTIRDQVTGKRRPFVRFFAAGADFSHEPFNTILPQSVLSGREPFIILGAMAGG